MKQIAMIGAGAMGGAMASALSEAGATVRMIETDPERVAAVREGGLRVVNLHPEPRALPIEPTPHAAGWADLAVIMTPTYATADAAETAAHVLAPGGAAVALQNGLGNYEAVAERLGAERVFMGSTMCSADRPEVGLSRITKIGPTTVGEMDGTQSDRARWLAEAFSAGGMPAEASGNIEGVLWSKCIHNCGINALSALTGLTMGEVTRARGLGDLRWQIVAEAKAVADARGVHLQIPDPEAEMRPHVWRKFTRPSMLQHVLQGVRTEIDQINGYMVAEGDRLGVPVPMNRLLADLVLARAEAAVRARAGGTDYAALTAQAEEEAERGYYPGGSAWS